MQYCVVVVINSGIVVLVEQVVVYQLVDCFLSKIRVDCACAVTEQCCKVVNLSRLAAFENNCKRSSLFGSNKVLVNC